MTKRKALDQCSTYKTAQILDGKWTILIFRDLLLGRVRFNQLRKSLGAISPKTLTDRLQFLEKEGIIIRTAFAEIPPRVEYELTKKGKAISPVLEAMATYGDNWLSA